MRATKSSRSGTTQSAAAAGRAKALQEQLRAVSGVKRNPAPEQKDATVVIEKGRKGRKAVAIYMQPLAKQQLDQIAHEHGKSIQALGIEALNLLFRHYDLKPIASG